MVSIILSRWEQKVKTAFPRLTFYLLGVKSQALGLVPYQYSVWAEPYSCLLHKLCGFTIKDLCINQLQDPVGSGRLASLTGDILSHNSTFKWLNKQFVFIHEISSMWAFTSPDSACGATDDFIIYNIVAGDLLITKQVQNRSDLCLFITVTVSTNKLKLNI